MYFDFNWRSLTAFHLILIFPAPPSTDYLHSGRHSFALNLINFCSPQKTFRRVVNNEFLSIWWSIFCINSWYSSICRIRSIELVQRASKLTTTLIHRTATTFVSIRLQDSSNRYNASSANLVNIPHFNQTHSPLLSKFRSDGSSGSGSGAGGIGTMSNKYNGHSASNNAANTMSNEYSIPSYTQSNASAHHQTSHEEKNHRISSTNYHQSNMGHQSQMPELTQDLCNALLNQQTSVDTKKVLQNVNSGWQSLAPSAAVADYLAQLPTSTLPLSLHHFLKYSSESIKKEVIHARRIFDL